MSDHHGIRRHVLRDGEVSVALLSLGCITQDWQVPAGGQRVHAVLGYADPCAYLHNPNYLGVVAGRVANRISGAAFEVGGQRWQLPANEGPNHLHGGPQGLHTRNWQTEPDGGRGLRLTLTSEHGEGGYPGKLDLTVIVTLRTDRLTYDMTVQSDRPTPVNLAQHSYYSLGAASNRRFEVVLSAAGHTPFDTAMIPTGKVAPLDGHSADFRAARTVEVADPQGQGLDLNYVLNENTVRVRGNGLILEMETDQPCIQLYTGTYLKPVADPLPGQNHRPFAGLCLEPQGYPNAVNTPGFPCPLVTPERPYRQTTSVRIRAEEGI